MAKRADYNILISCPSDVEEYLDSILEVVKDFNITYGLKNNVTICPVDRSMDPFPGFEWDPQNAGNSQMNDFELAVILFWTMFDESTGEYGSETLEETEAMINAGKTVFLYFQDKPIKPSLVKSEQYEKLLKFREKYAEKGLCQDIQNKAELMAKIEKRLRLYFDNILKGTAFIRKYGSKKILWVDDHPENNNYERHILEQYGLDIHLALSTRQALDFMRCIRYDLIISDMSRNEGPEEGYVLLEKVRQDDKHTPFIIYMGRTSEKIQMETKRRGGQGNVATPSVLLKLVISALTETSS